MRKIITTTFVTMDGVMQAPGGPEEDTSSGFKHGGWQAHVMDDSLRESLNELLKPPFAMLLGHTTYNIFAGFWPKQDPNHAIAKPFNEATKYVVSHERFEPNWMNTKVVSGDVPAALRELKAKDGPDMIVWGSGNLIQTLLREKLVDRMHVWIHPVTIGRDYGATVEIASGLTPADRVIDNPPDSLRPGDLVRVADAAPAGGAAHVQR